MDINRYVISMDISGFCIKLQEQKIRNIMIFIRFFYSKKMPETLQKSRTESRYEWLNPDAEGVARLGAAN